jgi:ligand-binding sensor domain-containing protein
MTKKIIPIFIGVGLILILSAFYPGGAKKLPVASRTNTPSPTTMIVSFMPTATPTPLFTVDPELKCKPGSGISNEANLTPTGTPTNIKLAPELPVKLIPYDKKHWTRYDNETMGFHVSYINHVAAGTDHAIWVSNDDGITRFDGKTWKIYSKAETWNIILGTDNTVWSRGDNGIMHFNGKDWITYSKQDGFDGYNTMFMDRKGNFWTVTFNSNDQKRQIARYNGQKWDFFDCPVYVNSIAEDKNGMIWFGGNPPNYLSRDNVISFDGKNWKNYNITNERRGTVWVEKIAFDSKGNLWCGAREGLYSFDGKNLDFISDQQLGNTDLESGARFFIMGNDDTILLQAFITGFLIKYKDGISTIYRNEYLSRLDPFVGIRHFIDNSGAMWIGGNNISYDEHHSLLKFSEAGWEVFDQPELGYVSNITQAPDGSMWIGSAGAVYHYQP